MEYKKLHLTCLDHDLSEKHAGYYYLVTSHSGPHTAFYTREALLAWLDLTGLTANDPIPDIGQYLTTKIIGSYRKEFTPFEKFCELKEDGFFYAMNNSRYTLGKFKKEDGIVTLYIHFFAFHGIGYFFKSVKTRSKMNNGRINPSAKKVAKWFIRNRKVHERHMKKLRRDLGGA